MSGRGFFSRIRGGDEDDTRIYSNEEIGAQGSSTRRRREPDEEQHPRGFTAERAAEIIDDLPPDVSTESAVRIVRGTLEAAGVRIEDLERSTRTRETKLNSEIDLARSRQRELRENTDEVIRSLEEKIRKAREARDAGVTEEEARISRASAGLDGLKRVRAFFGFPEAEEEDTAEPGLAGPGADEPEAARPGDVDPEADTTGDETRIFPPPDPDETRILRRPGPLSGADGPAGTSDER